jgi:serine/threonine-protein kinase
VPFQGETDADTALARLQRDPTDLGRLRPTLPVGLINLIHRTLARNPAHRPPTGADLRAALLAVDTTPPAIDGTPAEPPRRGLVREAAQAPPARPLIPGEPPAPSSSPPPPPVRRPRAGVRGRDERDDHRVVDDHTPPTRGVIRARPARGLQQRWTPSLVVIGGLLVVATVVGLILWTVLYAGGGDDDDGVPQTTVLPGGVDTAGATEGSTGTAAAVPAPIEITTIAAWDPDGTNGSENDAQAPLALADGSPATSWSTECYSSQYMGGKRGVGLIVTLSAPSAGRLEVESVNAPYALQVFASADATPPTAIEGWGEPLDDKAFAAVPGVVETTVSAPANHLLVWLTELGNDNGCTSANPYRGRLAEITFTA